MNPLAVGGLAAINFAALLIVVQFILKQAVILLKDHPAGAGLAALVL